QSASQQSEQRPALPRHEPRAERRKRAHAGESAEAELVRAMLDDHHRAELIAAKIGPEEFRCREYAAIFAAVLALGDEYSVERLEAMLDVDAVAAVNVLLPDSERSWNIDKGVEESLARLAERRITEQLTDIDQTVELASEAQKTELGFEKVRLSRERQGLGPFSRLSASKLLGIPKRRDDK
ncbi:MAG TPA: hypothetical protein VGT98_05015, partial [Candidatus Elarobacter sp.]|nr:hypothetical protein [Candidatus Elarobacter sp.]